MKKSELLALLTPEIEVVDNTMRQELAVTIANPLLEDIVNYAVFNGGKRIRPLLTILAARLCAFSKMPEGIAEEDELAPPIDLYRLSMVFEFLHAASLLHDDVIDHASQRRGKPSANTVWDNTHVILAGDFLHALAMTLAGTVGDKKTLHIIGSATTAMIEAEFLQMQTVEKRDLSEENYFAVLRGKTGALIGSACEVGACFTEATADQQAALRTFGDALGLAFQIVDDLLDYQGDPAQTGKAVGNDFIEGKMTLPLIHAISQAPDNDKKFILDLLKGDPQQRHGQTDKVGQLIEKYNGFSYARKGAETLADAAIAALEIFPDCMAKTTLTGLADYVLTREK
jgi:octaprenyl-diphosphate synthase